LLKVQIRLIELLWNPDKELKVLNRHTTKLKTNTKWNPDKELKVSMSRLKATHREGGIRTRN